MASAPPIKAPPTEGTALLLDAPEEEAGGVVRPAPSEASGCINDLRALTSVHNVALVAFLCVYVLGSAFYLENHESAFAASFDEDEVRVLNATFDTCFPIGGFVACLLIAPLMCYLRSSSLFLLIALFALRFKLTGLQYDARPRRAASNAASTALTPLARAHTRRLE